MFSLEFWRSKANGFSSVIYLIQSCSGKEYSWNYYQRYWKKENAIRNQGIVSILFKIITE